MTNIFSDCAPSYANLFMGHFERLYISPHSLLYLLYIDDIFMLWKGREKELISFIKMINEVHPTVKFHINHSRSEINFLDTHVQITSNNQLITILYKTQQIGTHLYIANPITHQLPRKVFHTAKP